jgi:hypothetical protein
VSHAILVPYSLEDDEWQERLDLLRPLLEDQDDVGVLAWFLHQERHSLPAAHRRAAVPGPVRPALALVVTSLGREGHTQGYPTTIFADRPPGENSTRTSGAGPRKTGASGAFVCFGAQAKCQSRRVGPERARKKPVGPLSG